jgi:peptidyl-prolyl cis-trans isomerase A (cyclophilin A)
MRLIIRNFAILACVLVVSAMCASARGGAAEHMVRIRIATSQGNIDAELDSARAPVTVTNFLRYVDAGLYRGGTFYRTVRADNQPRDTVKITVIQGGRREERAIPSFAPISLERTNATGLRHRDGTLSMARSGPNTATDAFFICVGDQPSLDFGGHRNLDGQGFAAFGRVTRGMDVVRRINAAPANARQRLTPPIQIISINRLQ